MENLTSFFEEALAHNDRAMTYMVSRRLSELFPELAVAECYDRLDMDGFVRYGSGEATLIHRLSPEVYANWNGQERTIERKLLTSWVEVEWRGDRYQVLRAMRSKCGWIHWIVGPEAKIDAFLRTIHAFAGERSPATHVYAGWWNESEAMDLAIQGTNWDEMVLPKALRQTLEHQTIGFFESRADYETLGVPWKRGLLLTGPPGNGKSLLIRSILNRLAVPRLFVKNFGDDVDDVGEVFDKVREMAPCVLVLEDIDALIKPELLSAVLNSLDGTEPLSGALVLATTNHPEKLDPAIKNRPSRFDRVIEFGPPEMPERRELLKKLFGRAPQAARLTPKALAKIAEGTEGFSFAYLKELAVTATLVWLREERKRSLMAISEEVIGELRGQIELVRTEPGEEAE